MFNIVRYQRNETQTMLRFHLPTIRVHKINKTKDVTYWRWGRKTFENLCGDSSEF